MDPLAVSMVGLVADYLTTVADDIVAATPVVDGSSDYSAGYAAGLGYAVYALLTRAEHMHKIADAEAGA